MVISFVIGIMLGAALLFWRNKTVLRRNRRIPKEWPLKTRPLVNTTERRVWIWLTKVMFDQHILIKLPITRFTTPVDKQEARHWYKLLNGVYCTFTVCSLDGRVIGCVDVQSPQGLSMGNQTLKHSLLSQCGVRYWAVDPDNLPHLTQIRTAFLGEHALKGSERAPLEARFKDVAGNLQAVVSRQRDNKSSNFARLDVALADSSGFPESRLASGWEQDSFVTPLDSRVADLAP